MKRIITAIALALSLSFGAVACTPDAQIASENISKAADQFEVQRRIVFYNGITGEYMLVIEGACSIEDEVIQLEVVCKTGTAPNGDALVKKSFLGLSDNVSYFVEQTEAAGVSTDRYRVIFKPESMIPTIEN